MCVWPPCLPVSHSIVAISRSQLLPGRLESLLVSSLIHPARYHDSRGWTADIHVDRALIVARIEFDWGACVVSDPHSDWSCASLKCTMCCAPDSSARISTSISAAFDTAVCLCVHCSSDTELIFCAHCTSVTEIMFCAHCSSDIILFTVTESEICLISDTSIVFSTLSGAVCEFCGSSWWLTGWRSVNTLTVFWGDDEYEWTRWWTESLCWVARVATQGSSRFPGYCSALLLHNHFHCLMHPADSSS